MDSFSPDEAGSTNGSPPGHVGIASASASVGTSPASNHEAPMSSASFVIDPRLPPPTVTAACLACRNKHLKCDGQTPCSRCTTSQQECIYVASRRGYKGPKKGPAPSANPHKRHASSSPPASTLQDSCPMLLGPGAVGVTSSSMSAGQVSAFNPALAGLPQTPHTSYAGTPSLNPLQIFRPQGFGGGIGLDAATNLVLAQHPPGPMPARVPVPTIPDRCLDSFYLNWHASHPFVLPKEFLLRIAEDTNVEHLLAAMRWIGSLYLDVGPQRAMFLEKALRLSYEATTPKDGFLVQALTIVLIGLDGCSQQDKARQILLDVEKIALEIGLNTRGFATAHGRGLPVLEESWRRTWWDLYVVDGMIAGVHRQTNFALFDVASDAALPCEEPQYFSASIPAPMSLEDLEDREFSGEEREFSSFAYRIAASRTLGKFMRIGTILGPEDENIGRIEAMITNWRLHLPQAKKDALSKAGTLDEMMFQAQMMTNATSILLHQPHSQLDATPTRSVNACAPYHPVLSNNEFNSHTRHTVESASEISKMVTYRVPVLSHTHFFACVITLSSIVHLSRWAMFYVPQGDEELRQQIRLNIGAANKMSEVWKSASKASGQVKGVAQEIYRAKKAQQNSPGFWIGFTQQEMMSSIATDETIMTEIETLGTVNDIFPG